MQMTGNPVSTPNLHVNLHSGVFVIVETWTQWLVDKQAAGCQPSASGMLLERERNEPSSPEKTWLSPGAEPTAAGPVDRTSGKGSAIATAS